MGAAKELSKEEMIARLVAHKEQQAAGPRLLTDGTTPGVAAAEGEEGVPAQKKARQAMTRESLPGNLYGMSVAQLKAVCAAHGFAPKSGTQAGIIQVGWFGLRRGGMVLVMLTPATRPCTHTSSCMRLQHAHTLRRWSRRLPRRRATRRFS